MQRETDDERLYVPSGGGGSPETPCSLKSSTTATAGASASNNNNNHHHHNHHNKEQDRFLPIANVGRIMKKVIPGNGKISKDAKETVQECVSEFISFVTGEASDKCQREKRKTINGEDIIWAITTLGFEDYVHPLKSYLHRYRDLEGEKLNVPKQQRSEQRLHQQQQQPDQQDHHNQTLLPYDNNSSSSVYSSTTNVMSQPSFMVDHHQAFSLPFSPSSIQKQFQPQQDQIDSVGHW
ncbi:nuclear transcription factor Y subunit B-7 [Pyrus communis]|uniref:nuclear transcription factor Y subunit B-7 n=1 Tax=Pyrus communis TaxID=23211 RepID=UPI0035C0100F